jgi:dipeptidyl aminopeptidase/acylaminoacyl peptidase
MAPVRIAVALVCAAGVGVCACGCTFLAVAPESPTAAPPTRASDGTEPELETLVAYESAGLIRVVGLSGQGARVVAPSDTTTEAAAGALPGGAQRHPDWSPDGTRIVFSLDEPDGTRDLWSVDVQTGASSKVVDCTAPCIRADDPAYSPDGGSIVFAQRAAVGDGTGVGTLEEIALDGGGPHTVHTAPPGEYPRGPRFSPDGRAIVFAVTHYPTAALRGLNPSGSTIEVVQRATGESSALTDAADFAGSPDWNPDGARLVFDRPFDPARPDGPADLYEAQLDDMPGGFSAIERLTEVGDRGGRATQASWRGEGESFVYVVESVPGGEPRIGITGAAGEFGLVIPDVTGTSPRMRPTPRAD